MTQEEKDLVLRDLCARLPYKVICQMEDALIINDSPFYDYILSERHIALFRNHTDFYIKPYLRPMSSMTEEEKNQWLWVANDGITEGMIDRCVDWLNAHHFDYRGLIPLELALEAPEGMYNN